MRYNTLVTVFFGGPFILLKLFLGENAFSSPITPENYPVAVIVIDPGHGGRDTGTIGIQANKMKGKSRQVLEKNLVLSLSKKVHSYLRNPKFTKPYKRRVFSLLTRNKDSSLSLSHRTRFAKQYRCDLFLSIHMNSEKTGSARGFETYFLNNTSSEINNHLVQLDRKEKENLSVPSDIRILLRSVTSDSMVNASLEAAKNIQNSVAKQLKVEKIPLESRGIRQSLLQVLLDAQAPAVLFEGPFLSNPEDLSLSTNPKVLDTMARGIATGIMHFLTSSERTLPSAGKSVTSR